jgi:LacI family transcriptional regulator
MAGKVTLFDIADALGVSTGTVHRALHGHPEVNPHTKTRVLHMAQSMGYRPNLAARYLSRKRNYRISINTLKGTTSFWDEVRSGIEQEAKLIGFDRVELEFRTYPRLEEGEQEAFEEALRAKVDGIISFPTHPKSFRGWMRRATRASTPVVCVATDAPDTGRLAVVSIDTMASGSLAADLIGRVIRGTGKVATTLSDLQITEHAEKCKAFASTLRSFYPQMQLVARIEDHDIETEAYDKCRELFQAHSDLAGMYITTEASIPVLDAARDAGILNQLTIVTTDIFPALVEHIRAGSVLATIYQRPQTQGRMAFRVLHEFLVNRSSPAMPVTLAPHLIMRGSLDLFLQRRSMESIAEKGSRLQLDSHELEGYAIE